MEKYNRNGRFLSFCSFLKLSQAGHKRQKLVIFKENDTGKTSNEPDLDNLT